MMKKEVGEIDFPIWLLGDSNPERWESYLNSPFDPRHPIRHNIWTSVLDEIQDVVFRSFQLRLDASRLYIRNAIENSNLKPGRYELVWGSEVESEIKGFAKSINRHKPTIIICFGSFSFEFARRSLAKIPNYSIDHWRTKKLGEAFRGSMKYFSLFTVNLIPLLHRSIAGGRFISSHNYFCEVEGDNYFIYVGEQIASKLLENRELINVWI
jgi:hypothetical protein